MSRSIRIAIGISALSTVLLTGCGQSPTPASKPTTIKVESGLVSFKVSPEMTSPVGTPDIPEAPLTGEKVSNYIVELNERLNECNSKLLQLDKIRVKIEKETK